VKRGEGEFTSSNYGTWIDPSVPSSLQKSDFAVFKTTKNFVGVANVEPIRLPKAVNEFLSQSVVIAGFGSKDAATNVPADILQFKEFVVADAVTCPSDYLKLFVARTPESALGVGDEGAGWTITEEDTLPTLIAVSGAIYSEATCSIALNLSKVLSVISSMTGIPVRT
jgi:hypothetical protein